MMGHDSGHFKFVSRRSVADSTADPGPNGTIVTDRSLSLLQGKPSPFEHTYNRGAAMKVSL